MSSLRRDNTRQPLFRRRTAVRLRFIVLLAIAALLFYLDVSGRTVQPVRQWTAWAMQPVAWVASLPRAVAHLGTNLRGRPALLAENRELRDKQFVLDARLSRMQALEAENRRLRSLLASSTTIDQRMLVAEILEASQAPYRNQILLDKGSGDDVYVGQAVVDAGGVLGQIIQVHRSTSVALLITDPQSGIPVEINRTGLHTVALGRGEGETLSLPFLPNTADIHIGDLLVSSGLGGRFPAGYPVGHITELRHPAGESFMEAIATPTAQIGQGRQVLLVWNGEGSPTNLPRLPVQIAPPGAAGTKGKAVRRTRTPKSAAVPPRTPPAPHR